LKQGDADSFALKLARSSTKESRKKVQSSTCVPRCSTPLCSLIEWYFE